MKLDIRILGRISSGEERDGNMGQKIKIKKLGAGKNIKLQRTLNTPGKIKFPTLIILLRVWSISGSASDGNWSRPGWLTGTAKRELRSLFMRRISMMAPVPWFS